VKIGSNGGIDKSPQESKKGEILLHGIKEKKFMTPRVGYRFKDLGEGRI